MTTSEVMGSAGLGFLPPMCRSDLFARHSLAKSNLLSRHLVWFAGVQRLDEVRAFVFRGVVEGGLASGVSGFDIRATIERHFHDFSFFGLGIAT